MSSIFGECLFVRVVFTSSSCGKYRPEVESSFGRRLKIPIVFIRTKSCAIYWILTNYISNDKLVFICLFQFFNFVNGIHARLFSVDSSIEQTSVIQNIDFNNKGVVTGPTRMNVNDEYVEMN